MVGQDFDLKKGWGRVNWVKRGLTEGQGRLLKTVCKLLEEEDALYLSCTRVSNGSKVGMVKFCEWRGGFTVDLMHTEYAHCRIGLLQALVNSCMNHVNVMTRGVKNGAG